MILEIRPMADKDNRKKSRARGKTDKESKKEVIDRNTFTF